MTGTANPEPPRSRLIDELAFLPIRGLRAGLCGLEPPAAIRIGAALGRVVARFGSSARRTALRNLELAFPDTDATAREALLADCFANLGRGVAELALLQGPRRAALLAGVELVGVEHLEAARAASPHGGVLVLTAHFGSWDLCAAALAARGHPLSVVHRGFGNPRLDAMLRDVRTGGREDALDQVRMGGTAAFGVMRALRAGRDVAVLLDQNARAAEGVFVPFFGRLACTRSAPALIAMRQRVPVLPAFVHRCGASARHEIRLQPHLDLEPAGDDPSGALHRNVATMTRVIERVIRDAPDHWLWPHRRWRTRPEASDDPAERRAVYPPRAGRRGKLLRELGASLR